MEPREVVARALREYGYDDPYEEDGVVKDVGYVSDYNSSDEIADHILAALAADPGVVERAARGMYEARFGTSHFLPWDELPEDMAPFNRVYYRRAARAALAAALTPEAGE